MTDPTDAEVRRISRQTLRAIYAELRGASTAPDMHATKGRVAEALRLVIQVIDWGDPNLRPAQTSPTMIDEARMPHDRHNAV